MINYVNKKITESVEQLETPYYYEHDLSEKEGGSKHKHIVYGEIRNDKITEITISSKKYTLEKTISTFYFSGNLPDSYVCYLSELFKSSKEKYLEALNGLYEDVLYIKEITDA
jgi:hypothetical protein